jgi:salicylate hydroxylase
LRRAVGANWVGPGRHVVTYPLRRGELVNFVGVVERQGWETESWTARGSREDCAADFAGWHPDVHALIDNIDVHYRWALMSRPPIERWSSGNVVLLGDLPSDAAVHGARGRDGDRRRNSSGAVHRGASRRSRSGYSSL